MRSLLPWLLGLVVGVSAQAAEVEPTPSALESDPTGWVDLLPGPDLAGWSRVPVPPTGTLGRAQWHVDTDRRVLICDGDGGHDMLLWDKVVGDAIFHLEFRYTRVEGVTGYNSGAYIRNSANGAIWHQAQFGDADGGYFFGVTPVPNARPTFFILKNQMPDSRVRPAGEWNTLELTARGKSLSLWVNGAVTSRFEDCGLPRGHVGVEGEGYRIEFRNLKLKELEAPATGEAVALFNGQDLDNWHAYLSQHGVAKEEVWSVRDGLLVCTGEPMGYLYTDRTFESFKLVVEWRWAPGQKPGNNGVLMRINGQPRPLPRCLEAQLQHGNAGDLYGFHGMRVDGEAARKIDAQTTGPAGHIQGVKKRSGNENPPGEWNRYEIVLDGPRLTASVNGQQVNAATDCEVIAGPVGIQSEGGVIHFRKIELTPLP